jgi:hypothetical protein
MVGLDTGSRYGICLSNVRGIGIKEVLYATKVSS